MPDAFHRGVRPRRSGPGPGGAGETQQARTSIGEAERALEGIVDPADRDAARGSLAVALAGIGEYERAERLTYYIANPSARTRAIVDLADALTRDEPIDRQRPAGLDDGAQRRALDVLGRQPRRIGLGIGVQQAGGEDPSDRHGGSTSRRNRARNAGSSATSSRMSFTRSPLALRRGPQVDPAHATGLDPADEPEAAGRARLGGPEWFHAGGGDSGECADRVDLRTPRTL
ncbi:hypothetical protein [Pseudonocardia thermophila]|uniref:hypothetical protein n=1 Tax=Pseudonocardia thermophila TaxID=1848 RepID=UPI00248E54C1|nr:hypothetical protein [Pseudonocardia thermophila]